MDKICSKPSEHVSELEQVSGSFCIYRSRLPNGEEDRASLHGGEPVLRGEKWIATRWFKELDDEKPKSIEE